MTELGWLIYLASVLGNLRVFLFLAMAVFVSIAIVLAIVKAGSKDKLYQYKHNKEDFEAEKKFLRGTHITASLIALCVSAFLMIVVPGKNTVYLMAGASVAQNAVEDVAISPEMVKVRSVLNKKLDEMLEEPVE